MLDARRVFGQIPLCFRDYIEYPNKDINIFIKVKYTTGISYKEYQR
jgi:hypothetical protein